MTTLTPFQLALRAKADQEKAKREDRPVNGKTYSLSQVAKTGQWAGSEVVITPDDRKTMIDHLGKLNDRTNEIRSALQEEDTNKGSADTIIGPPTEQKDPVTLPAGPIGKIRLNKKLGGIEFIFYYTPASDSDELNALRSLRAKYSIKNNLYYMLDSNRARSSAENFAFAYGFDTKEFHDQVYEEVTQGEKKTGLEAYYTGSAGASIQADINYGNVKTVSAETPKKRFEPSEYDPIETARMIDQLAELWDLSITDTLLRCVNLIHQSTVQ